jgi:hypothetical protein
LSRIDGNGVVVSERDNVSPEYKDRELRKSKVEACLINSDKDTTEISLVVQDLSRRSSESITTTVGVIPCDAVSVLQKIQEIRASLMICILFRPGWHEPYAYKKIQQRSKISE